VLTATTGDRGAFDYSVPALDIVIDDRHEIRRDAIAAQGDGLFTIDEDRRRRRLAGPG
jgi:hypothetical protein